MERNVVNISIDLQSTENSYTFQFKGTPLNSIVLNSLYILPRQERLTFELKG